MILENCLIRKFRDSRADWNSRRRIFLSISPGSWPVFWSDKVGDSLWEVNTSKGYKDGEFNGGKSNERYAHRSWLGYESRDLRYLQSRSCVCFSFLALFYSMVLCILNFCDFFSFTFWFRWLEIHRLLASWQ